MNTGQKIVPLTNVADEGDRSGEINLNLAVVCRQVSKEFGSGDTKVQALRDVNMDVRYGEMTLLVGPSGCGKTTLISVICGLLDVSSGDVFVLGQQLSKMGGGRKTRFRSENVGFVFQQYNLLPALTTVENVSVPLIIAGWHRKKAFEKAAEILVEVGLSDKLKMFPNQLSGGQQQRVAIARALVHDPRLLVCDEPTAALDGKSGQTVMELLKRVGRRPDRAVVVVTHDNRVFRFGDRIITMSDGTVESVKENTSELSNPYPIIGS
jgi:putative ABC transport system ATP-binding protein